MLTHTLRAALLTVLICAIGLPHAYADVYAWVDESGTVVLSDVTPPPGVRIINTVRDGATSLAPTASIAASHDAGRQAEVQNLSERVRQLEREVQLASSPAPLDVQYTAVSPPGANTKCDAGWADCWWGQNPGIYPVGVVVLAPTRFHRFGRFQRAHRFGMPRAGHFSTGFHRH
jgi:hypothetical protein